MNNDSDFAIIWTDDEHHLRRIIYSNFYDDEKMT